MRTSRSIAQLALCLGLIPLLLLYAVVAAARAWLRPVRTSRSARLQVVLPYPPGEKSGASKAMQGLLHVLSESYEIATIPLYSLDPGVGRFMRRIADVLTWPLPMAVYCRPFVVSPSSVTRRLVPDRPVLVEFVSGAMFLVFGRRPIAQVVLRDHEVLCRRLIMESKAARGLDRVVGWARVAAAYLLTAGIYLTVDKVIALTPEDGAFLKSAFPWLRQRVLVIPATIELPPEPVTGARLATDDAALFLANFYHRPNIEGLQWFLRECAPHLRRPITLHLVGLDDPIRDMSLESPNVRIVRHGFVEDVNQTLGDVRVAIAPLISGGGIRIKNLYLASLAKAVVTTPLGNQGIGFQDGHEARICNDGIEMARAIDSLVAAPDDAVAMGSHARSFVARNFGGAATLERYRTDVFALPDAPVAMAKAGAQ